MLVHQAFRFELDPSNATRSALSSHCGASRYAFNWGLRLVNDQLEATRKLTVLAIRQGAGVDTDHVGPQGHRSSPLLAPGAATGVERHQARGGPVVGRELEGGVLLRARRPRPGARELVEGASRRAGRTHGLPDAEEEGAPEELPVHDRFHRGRRRPSCEAPAYRAGPDQRAGDQAPRAARRRTCAHLLGHNLRGGRPVVRQLHLRGGAARCARPAARRRGRCRPRSEAPRGALYR